MQKRGHNKFTTTLISVLFSSYVLHEKPFTSFYKFSEYDAFLVMRNGKLPLICLFYGIYIFIDLHPILPLSLYLRVPLHLEIPRMKAIPHQTILSLISPLLIPSFWDGMTRTVGFNCHTFPVGFKSSIIRLSVFFSAAFQKFWYFAHHWWQS